MSGFHYFKLAGPRGETLPPSVTRADTQPGTQVRVPGEMPPAARAILDVVREAKGSLDQLYALVSAGGLTRGQVDLIGGLLWTKLGRARKELVKAGHPGGPGRHPGSQVCPVCDLVDWLDETHPAPSSPSSPAPPSSPGAEA